MAENGRNKIIVELDFFNYPTKSDVKSTAGVIKVY